MGFRGDAMNLEAQLSKLLEYQGLVLEIRKLEQKAQQLKIQAENDVLREQLLQKSTELSANLAASEALAREKRRIHEEQQLVAKRLEQDQSRLKTTAVPRDAISLQHEIETLEKRSRVLSEELSGVELEIASQNETHHQIERERESLERDLELQRESLKLELEELRNQHASNKQQAASLRTELDEALLSEFDKKSERGVAIGLLLRNTCGACNMSLTSTAINALLATPKDQILHCPECSAILVRQ
jgi:predicted  nucleic acid-binding Zn-ribbon protein